MTTWVLLRGWTREAGHWGGFIADLRAQLPGGDRVIAPDLPGNGARHCETSPTRVAEMVEAVRSQLRASGETGPFVLLALSLGGMVALEWARAHPGELQACVLVNTSMRGAAPFWQRLRPVSYPRLAGILRPGLQAVERERRILGLTSNLRSQDKQLPTEWAALASRHPVSRANMLRQLRAAARFEIPEAPPAVPLLLLASEADRLVSVQCSRALAARWSIPLRLHPSAGHDLPLDAPHWVASEAVAWWRSAPH